MKMKEIWKEIEGFPLYEVSNMGRVRSWNGLGRASGTRSRSPKILSQCVGKNNRPYLRLGGKRLFKVSTLVCEAFHGKRFGEMECCHNDGDPTNNKVTNLRWDTRSGNHADRLIHGTSNRGERHGMSRLAKKDVLKIKKLFSNGLSQARIAKMFSISQQHVSKVVNGKRWGWLEV